jgi:hypothetical protein
MYRRSITREIYDRTMSQLTAIETYRDEGVIVVTGDHEAHGTTTLVQYRVDDHCVAMVDEPGLFDWMAEPDSTAH